MGMLAQSGVITSGTLGNIVIPLSFTPKFFMMMGQGPSAGGFADNSEYNMGVTDGTNKWFFNFSQLAGAGGNNFGGVGTTLLYQNTVPAGGGVTQEFDLVAFNAGDVTINANVSDAGTAILWLALGEDVLSDVHTMMSGVGVGTLSKTGMAFQPNFLLGRIGGGAQWGLGATADSLEDFALQCEQYGGVPTETANEQRTTRFISKQLLGVYQNEFTLSAYNADGYTLNRLLSLVDSLMTMVALQCPGAVVGTITQPTSNGIQTINPGIRPRAIFIASWGAIAPAGDPQINNGIRNSYGIGTDSDSACFGVSSQDGASPSIAKKFFSGSTIISLINDSGSVVAEATLDSIGSTTFDLNWTLTDATARQMVYFVLGEPVVVTTDTVINIAPTTAESGGNVTSDGSVTITQKGVCWSTVSPPTTADSLTNDGSGVGAFTSNLTGLIPATTYFVRAYAIADGITYYGDEETFMTAAVPVASAGGLMLLGVGN